MNVSFLLGLLTGLVVGMYLGAHPKKVMSFSSSLGLLLVVGAFYAMLIVGIGWLAVFLSRHLGLARWQFGVVLVSMIGVGIVINRLLTERNNRSSK